MGKIVTEVSWTEPLDWDLYATHEGEIRVPFRRHVQPIRQTYRPASNFSQFIQLPTELQLHIVRFCDSAMLFQLMQVSSATRKEAKKLFWSCSETWYHIDGSWLLAGSFSGHTDNDLKALAYMKQVEVDFGARGPLSHNAWVDGVRQWAEQPSDDVRDRQIHNFWRILQHRLPCATEVVLKERGVGGPGAPAPAELVAVAEKCPPAIRTFVSSFNWTAENYKRLNRISWQRVRPDISRTAAWEVLDPSWTRRSVLPPPKQFSGPVGAFCRIGYLSDEWAYRYFAIQILLIHATEAYYLQDTQATRICPASECGLQFELPGQWAIHATEAGHDFDINPPGEGLKALFEEHTARLACLKQQYIDAMTTLRKKWGKEGSKQRRKAENAFLSQLQYDSSYTHQKTLRESAVWLHYVRRMNSEVYLG